MLKQIIMFSLLGGLLIGCSTNDTVEKNAQPKEKQEEVQDINQTVPAQKIAGTIKLEYDFGTNKETVDAHLWQGQGDYHIFLPETVVATKDSNGKDIIKTKEIPESSLEIVKLEQDTDLDDLLRNEKSKLEKAFPGVEIKKDTVNGSKFSGKLLHSLSVMNDNQGTSIYIVEINDTVFKFTMNLWASEKWEVTRFIAMINSITITPQGAAI
jgi:hypothetical protein